MRSGPPGPVPSPVPVERRRPSMAARRRTDGPRVRLGVAWSLLLVGAAVASPLALGIVLGAAAGLAADHVVQLRSRRMVVRRRGRRHRPAPVTVVTDDASRPTVVLRWLQAVLGDPARLVAALGALALPLAAVAGPDTVAAALVAVVALALAAVTLSTAPGVEGSRLTAAGSAIATAVAFGCAAASVVVLRAEGVAAVVILLLLVSVHQAADYLVGAGSDRWWVGPLAGAGAVTVVGAAAALVALVPLGRTGPIILAGIVAVVAPVGPPLVSALVGDGGTPAHRARRLAVWVAVAPVASWAGAVIAS